MGVLPTDALDYELPPELLATRAAEPRDSARLMVVSRSDPSRREHRRVSELTEFLGVGDVLVFNTTRVLPARLEGVRVGTGGRVGGLYLGPGPGSDRWVVLLRAGHLRAGARVSLLTPGEEASGVELELESRGGEDGAGWVVRVIGGPAGPETLERVGRTPLPPYILHARKQHGERVGESADRDRYQTVYAGGTRALERDGSVSVGSVAAPTAGLHFTPGLLERLRAAGVERAEVTLHVGTGTFKPVEAAVVEDHPMHAELCAMSPAAVSAVRAPGKRVIAVGTTSARTLESYAAAGEGGAALPETLSTRLLITPGYRWRWTRGLMTNFHLPRSTLMAMVASLLAGEGEDPRAGVERLRGHYAEAIRERYRFYSFGDAMLVLP